MNKGWLVNTADWIERHHLAIAQQFGPISLTIMAVWVGFWMPDAWATFSALGVADKTVFYWIYHWTPWLFTISVVIAIYGGVLGSIDSKSKDIKIDKLRNEISENNDLSNRLEEAQLAIDHYRIQHAETIFNVTSDYLGHLSDDHLNYNDTERVSLYLHNGTRFIIAGRYSKNTDLIKVNRSAFPDNEGCIGKTWQHGGQFFVELPNDEAEYLGYLKTNLGVDKRTARALRMQSRTYCSFALQEGYKRIGIIMFESTNNNILNEDILKSLVREHKGYLIEMLKRTKSVNALVAYQNEGN